MPNNLQQICTLLDKLSLEALSLMQQHIQAKMSLEESMSDGEAHLVKSRYIMGHRNVSALQIPTEDSAERHAVARIHSCEDDELYGQRSLDLEIVKKSDEDSEYHDPLHWFGVLVPQDLRKAQTSYRRALVWSVKCVNIQTKLRETCIKIKQLRELKSSIAKNEE